MEKKITEYAFKAFKPTKLNLKAWPYCSQNNLLFKWEVKNTLKILKNTYKTFQKNLEGSTCLKIGLSTWKQLKSSLQCCQHCSSVKSIQKLSPGSWSDPWFQFEHQPSLIPWTYGFDSSYSTIILSGLQNILVGAGFSQRTPSATIVPYAIFVYLWNFQP